MMNIKAANIISHPYGAVLPVEVELINRFVNSRFISLIVYLVSYLFLVLCVH